VDSCFYTSFLVIDLFDSFLFSSDFASGSYFFFELRGLGLRDCVIFWLLWLSELLLRI
jgi:hypothetical protein